MTTSSNGHAPSVGVELLPDHAERIVKSAIRPQVAEQRGYRSVTDAAELEALGFAPEQRRTPALLVPIYNATGELAYYQLRPDDPRERDGKPQKYETASKRWRARRGLPSRGFVVDVPPGARTTIGDPDTPLWITEGARKADAAVSIGLCCVDLIGVWGFRRPKEEDPAQGPLPDWEHFALVGRRVYVAFDSDVMVKPSVRKALTALKAFLDHQGADVRLVYLPGGDDGEKVGLDDFLAGGGTERDLLEFSTAELREPANGTRGPSAATQLIKLTDDAGAELFHTPSGDTWATVPVDGHRETHPTGSAAFRRWLARGFRQNGSTVGAQALQDALLELEGRAAYDGPEREVHTRVAEHDDAIYVDLGDTAWQAIEIRESGWRITANLPVKFRRKRGALALPVPVAGGSIDELRGFVNVADDDAWTLLVGWLLGAFSPHGPYAMLALHGEQGSAKSTTARILRSLIDPNTSDLRSEPRNARELMIAATNGWVLAFDNLSDIQSWLSDALCRLSTGGGFATRQLHTDDEEVLFDAQRPLLITGIEELATRSDLLDRTIVLNLPRLREVRTERTLWDAFETTRPRVLGALLTAVTGALSRAGDVELERLPRLADFAVFVTAAEPELGWERGRFLATYDVNRAAANDIALEASPIGHAVLELARDTGGFEGELRELLALLEERVGEAATRQRGWPKNARSLSSHISRVAPNLRAAGVDVNGPVREAGTGRRIWTLSSTPALASRPSHPSHQPPESQAQSQIGCDANADPRDAGNASVTQTSTAGDAAVTQDTQPEIPHTEPNRDGRDGRDANAGISSRSPSPRVATTEEQAEVERAQRKFGDEEGGAAR